MRQFISLALLTALLTGCADKQPVAISSPLYRPTPVTEEQLPAPTMDTRSELSLDSPFPKPAEMPVPASGVDEFSAQIDVEPPSFAAPEPSVRSNAGPAFFGPRLSLDNLRQLPLHQLPLPAASNRASQTTHRVYLPYLLAIDPRVRDAQAKFDCSQAELLDERQCHALVFLYALTNGPGWTKSDGWLEDKNPCKWYRVGCPEPEYNLAKLLLLENNNLSGRLPYELHQLPLTFLRLSNNNLTGSIPPSIVLMIDLEEIRLENNLLSGPVSSEIVNFPRMREFNLSGNPGLYFDKTHYICANDLPIPQQECEALVAIYQEMNGTEWDFAGNDLSLYAWLVRRNPCKWAQVTCKDGHVHALELSRAQMTGHISASFSNISHLWSLSLANNQLSGPVPIEIGSLAHLTYLNLRDNDETLCMPQELHSFVEVQLKNGYHPPPGGYCP